MTRDARLISGIIFITVPTIQSGDFLLSSLMERSSGYMDNGLGPAFEEASYGHPEASGGMSERRACYIDGYSTPNSYNGRFLLRHHCIL